MIAEFYQSFFLVVLFFLSISVVNKNNSSLYYYGSDDMISTNKQSELLMWAVVLFIGLRPVHAVFADTIGYVMRYENEIAMPASWSEVYYSEDVRNEWLWHFILMACARLGLPSWCWLTIVAWGYIGCALWGIKRIFQANHTYIAFLFFISAFSFFSYAVNGLRNGLSFSVVILALTYLDNNKRDLIKFGILSFIAYNIHHTALLPLVCMVISHFGLKSNKIAFYVWFLSIPVSLFAHSFFEAILIDLAPDDRLADNLSAQYSGGIDSGFSRSGFRWDFLLYSIMPIILSYFIILKNNVTDKTYTLLLNTYLLCNAFWILVIRASFSNRFAYLSWFIYPIVLAYPLLELDFTKNQKKWIANILLAHLGFTAFMHFIFY